MTTKPTAHISVSKNRVKKGHEVYLKDDTEFEIELYNPTEHVVCARIWINGMELQGGNLVLYPAQRHHLDRYLDEPKKFKFSTYKVSGSQAEIEQAIKNNGLIQVKFYNEIIPVNNVQLNGGTWQMPNSFPPYYPGPGTSPTVPNIWYGDINHTTIGNSGTTITSLSGNVSNTLSFNSAEADLTSCNFFCSTPNETFDLNDLIIEPALNDEFKDDTPIESPKITESGRIEAGSKSDQEFTKVNLSFAFSPCAEYEYVILPMSRKVIEAKEVGSTVYCTGCKLRKRKPQWKFCPKCGTEFEL